jgi:hemerythrin
MPATPSDSELAPKDVDVAIAAVLRSVDQAPEEDSQDLRSAIVELERRLTAQLAREELAMHQAGYPLLDGHEAAHDLLLTEARRLLNRAGQADATPASRRAAIRDVASRFHAHVLSYDLGLAEFVRRCRAT